MKIEGNILLMKYESILRQKQKELFKAQTEIDFCYQVIDDIKTSISHEERKITENIKKEAANDK